MGYRDRVTGVPTWNRGHSDFEGLSRVCGEELYPRTGTDEGVDSWIGQNPRDYQYIETTDPEGENDLSHSASWNQHAVHPLLAEPAGFQSQRDHRESRPTPAQTYHNLTGRSDARQAFHDLVEQFLPAGRVSSIERDDPFPFLPPHRRRVSLDYTTEITEGLDMAGLKARPR